MLRVEFSAAPENAEAMADSVIAGSMLMVLLLLSLPQAEASRASARPQPSRRIGWFIGVSSQSETPVGGASKQVFGQSSDSKINAPLQAGRAPVPRGPSAGPEEGAPRRAALPARPAAAAWKPSLFLRTAVLRGQRLKESR